MNCAEARAAIVDRITGNASPEDARALDAHLAQCRDCRETLAELAAVWEDLGRVSPPAPPKDALERFTRAAELDRLASVSARPAWQRWIGLAAVLLAGAIGGYSVGLVHARAQREAAARIAVASDTGTYLLLLYEDTTSRAGQSPQDGAKIVAEYANWARSLAAAGKLVSAAELAEAPSRWYGAAGRGVDDGPNGDRLGGFFLIRASGFAEAQRIAADCPHLRHGGRVELRTIQPT